MTESQVRVPSDMIAIADAYEEGLRNPTMLYPEAPWGPQHSALGTPHSLGANLAFCDGHVEYGKKKQWIKPTEAARKRWNNDNQPHPETWRTSG
jgi:prepilin-type processing-associated H-X9-DG protein